MQGFRIISGSEITLHNIQQALDIDRLVYGDVFQANIERCLDWFEKNNDIYTITLDEDSGKVVAYINLSPVNDEYYEIIKNGEFIDVNLPVDAIETYKPDHTYNLYMSSIAIHPDYSNKGLLKPLFEAVIKKMILFWKNNVYVKRLVADAVTDKGKKLCELFGMTRVNTTVHSSEIYEVCLIPPQFRIISRATKELYDLCSEK